MKNKIIKPKWELFFCFFAFFCFFLSEEIHGETTDSSDVMLEVSGLKKDIYKGSIYNQLGEKIKDFTTTSNGEFSLLSSDIEDNDKAVYVFLKTQKNVIPMKGLGGDYKSQLFYVNVKKKNSHRIVLRFKLLFKGSTFATRVKITPIDKLLNKSSEGLKISLYKNKTQMTNAKVDKNGVAVFDSVASGEYTLNFESFKDEKYIPLINYMKYTDKVYLNMNTYNWNKNNWFPKVIYIVSLESAVFYILGLIVLCIPLLYVGLGFSLPKKEIKNE